MAAAAAAAAAYTLSLAPISLPLSSSSFSSNSKRPISSSLSFLLPQTPKTSFLSIQPIVSLPQKQIQTHRRQSTSTHFQLPTAKPDRAPADKIPKWSARSIKSFGMAELEARKLKYPTTGTEALLMGILVEGTSEAAQFLRANGITLVKVREETVKLLGKSDMYFFSPEHPPLTEPAQRALDWAVDEKMKSGPGQDEDARRPRWTSASEIKTALMCCGAEARITTSRQYGQSSLDHCLQDRLVKTSFS